MQATSLELRAFVELELEKNPFLSQEESELEIQTEEPERAEEENAGTARQADFEGEENFSSEIAPKKAGGGGDDSSEIESDYFASRSGHQHAHR